MLVQTWGCYDFTGSMAFDPYRQRLVFCSAIVGTDPGPIRYLWFADGAGNLQNLSKDVAPGASFNSIAPTADGRIYCFLDTDIANPIRWIDAANQFHVLYDSDGVTPMKIDGNGAYSMNGMIHDAATNALFVASTKPAPGFPEAAVNVRKLSLSADGSRVIGPVGNATFEISPNPPASSSGETPRGWSRGPNGKLVLVVLSIDAEVMPRMLLVDPVTSAISAWGSNGDTGLPNGCSTNTGGAYCSTLNKVVVADYWNMKLRAYAQGSTGGPGTVIPASPASLTQNGYYLNVVAVPPDACSGAWVAYGLGLPGKGALVPKLTGAGCAEPGAGVTLTIWNAVGGASAALFAGLSTAALPFKGGTFHVGSTFLMLGLPLGGASGLAGAGTLSLPAALPSLPALSGFSVFLQAAVSDAAAVHAVSLTQGLQLAIG
ncbi:MAG TPA: hypothetical protein VK824_00820 [Planctomycetota bacterium]|nr:hypothetical protein [Planctomycetota bacterium]